MLTIPWRYLFFGFTFVLFLSQLHALNINQNSDELGETVSKKIVMKEYQKRFFETKKEYLKNVPENFDKKSWNIPLQSLKWYAQSRIKSNKPQMMYEMLHRLLHN